LVWLQEAAFVLKNHFFPEFSQNFPFLFGKFFQPDIKAASWVQTELTGSEYSPPDALETPRTAGGGYRASPYQNFPLRLQTEIGCKPVFAV
jgi:hypothetical protein